MRDAVDAGNVEISVGSEAEARKLREDFADLTQRVNMDLVSQTFQPRDPISIEMAVAQAERSIDYHLTFFPENPALQALAPALKEKFAAGIRAQMRA